MRSCPGRSAARSPCEAVRCRAGAVTSAAVGTVPVLRSSATRCIAPGTRGYLTRRGRRRVEYQRKAVHAVAQAGRLRAVVEDVAEMAAAAATVDFGAQHAEGAVLGLADGVFQRLVKTRPAGAALELGVGGKQRQVAAGAGEDALAMFFQQRARPRPLGALLAQNVVLLRRQLRAPFGVGLFDLEFFRSLRRRHPQPAERGKAEQAGERSKQDAAVEHGMSPGCNALPVDTARPGRSYTLMPLFLSLCCELGTCRADWPTGRTNARPPNPPPRNTR